MGKDGSQMENPDVPGGAAPASRRDRSPIVLLADRPSRAILLALGDARARGIAALAVTEQSLASAKPRLIRDRLRDLEREGIVIAIERRSAQGAAPTQWGLTEPGRDLYRLQSLMSRIISHAAELNAATSTRTREVVIEQTLGGLTDPVTTAILRFLASSQAPVPPLALEAGCAPTPRRTLYRRLGTLVDAGVVIRTSAHTMPRSTTYEFAGRWRPAAALPMLGAWWESRHREHATLDGAVDLEGIVHAILPRVRIDRRHDGRRLLWRLDRGDSSESTALVVAGDRLHAEADANSGSEAEARVTGAAAAWATAFVTDRIDGLTISGDPALARDAVNAVRGALLAYLR